MSATDNQPPIIAHGHAVRRTAKRSRSGAHEKCPDCGKLLRGNRGMQMHRKQMHGGA